MLTLPGTRSVLSECVFTVTQSSRERCWAESSPHPRVTDEETETQKGGVPYRDRPEVWLTRTLASFLSPGPTVCRPRGQSSLSEPVPSPWCAPARPARLTNFPKDLDS